MCVRVNLSDMVRLSESVSVSECRWVFREQCFVCVCGCVHVCGHVWECVGVRKS